MTDNTSSGGDMDDWASALAEQTAASAPAPQPASAPAPVAAVQPAPAVELPEDEDDRKVSSLSKLSGLR